MIASLYLSTILTYSFLNLRILSDSNRYVIVRVFNEEVKMVKTFSWYVWKGENNKVINQDGNLEEKWVMLDVVDFEGSVLFSSKICA
jgi:hypothetical protein